MGWVYLFIAGALEISWAVGIKYTDNFTRLWPSVLTITAMVLNIYLLSRALNYLPLGTAYAVWTGIGVMGTTILGIFLFREPVTVIRLAMIGLICVGMIGLKITTPSS